MSDETLQQRVIRMTDERGDLVTGDDGYVVYWPCNGGCLPAYALRYIADELDRRNAAWDAEVTKSFGGEVTKCVGPSDSVAP